MGSIQHLPLEEIESLLAESFVGRLACNAPDDHPYMVPIAFAYDGESIYFVTGPGRKLDLMRADPRVTFEVDRVERSDTWRSAVVEATFAEADDPDERLLAIGLLERTTGLPVVVGDHSVVVRLRITGRSGRFERPD